MTARRTRPLLALCALLGVACYEYLPAGNSSSLIAQRVQLALTDSGSVAMASKVGPSVEAIEGTLIADSVGTYIVAVKVTRGRRGAEVDWRGGAVGKRAPPGPPFCPPPRPALRPRVCRWAPIPCR